MTSMSTAATTSGSPRLGMHQLIEHSMGRARCLGEPARALAAVASHGLERRAADDLGQLIRGAQLVNEAVVALSGSV